MRHRKEHMTITFVRDEDVLGHIIDITEKHKEGKKKSRNKRSKKMIEETPSEVMRKDYKLKEKHDKSEVEDVRHATSLFDENSKDVSGSDVFSFKPAKSKNQLHQRALEAAKLLDNSLSTPKSKIEEKSEATKPGKKSKVQKKVKETPDKQDTKPVLNTPYSLRQRNKKKLVKTVQEESSSSEDSSAEDLSSSDEEKEVGKNAELDIRSKEDFFLLRDNIHTSDHTLARLDTARLDQSSYHHLLENVSSTHSLEIGRLLKNYKCLYKKWMLLMSQGFNVLLHGMGSKRALLGNFQETMLSDFHSIIINGFTSNLTLKEILSSIIEELLEMQSTSQNVQEQINFLKDMEVDDDEELFLIINSIDGVMLRSDNAQNFLCQLAAIPWIHVIASIDHINAPIMWDQVKLSQFNWIWFDITTFEPYKEEVVFENSLLVQPTSGLMLRSLIHVYRSLNPRAKEIFLLILRYQLDHKDDSTYIGLSQQECYRKCNEGFLVNSDLTLKAQLTEFKDHKLIKVKKGQDGSDYLIIPLDSNSLSEFLEHHA